MSKEWIINTWEQDWDNENMYYRVRRDGMLIKVDLETGDIFKYRVEEVVH
jgi:hypothetical protein